MGLGLAACTALPGDGPWMGGAQTTSTEALPFDVIDLTPTTVVAYRQPPTPDKPVTTTSSLSAAQRLTVAPGDSLRVRIYERYGGNIFPTIQGQSADLGIQRVAEDGQSRCPTPNRRSLSNLASGEPYPYDGTVFKSILTSHPREPQSRDHPAHSQTDDPSNRHHASADSLAPDRSVR
jgi:hypothetical protein